MGTTADGYSDYGSLGQFSISGSYTPLNNDEALLEVLEDSRSFNGSNNANGTAITTTHLAAITGITGVVLANELAYQEEIKSEISFFTPPTVAQVQEIIDNVNERATFSINVLYEVLEDSRSLYGSNNANGTSVTAFQLRRIIGITRVETENILAYQEKIKSEIGFDNPPTVAQVQEIIDNVNERATFSINALDEVLEDSDSPDGANNANETAVTAFQLLRIIGITRVETENELAYQAAIGIEVDFSNPPTVAQVQVIIC